MAMNKTSWSVKFLPILIVLAVSGVAVVQARRCYVCGEGSEAPFRTTMAAAALAGSTSHHQLPIGAATTTIPSLPQIAATCDDFERDRDELDKYVLECPPTYTSCLTQVDGDMELRTCGESLSINDCKSANKIDYCYCNEDLCNSLKRTQIRREIEDSQRGGGQSEHLKQHHEPNNSDDEDLSESSGMDPDSHEKHRNHRLPIGLPGHPGGHHDATTQIVMTLKPVPTTERRNNHGTNGSAATSSARWPSEHHSRSSFLLAMALLGASYWWRFSSQLLLKCI